MMQLNTDEMTVVTHALNILEMFVVEKNEKIMQVLNSQAWSDTETDQYLENVTAVLKKFEDTLFTDSEVKAQ